MKVTTSFRNGVLVAVLSGELDTFDADGLGDALEKVAHADASGVVLDCRAVTYIASMGLGMLVNLAKQARAHGMHTRVAGASPAVRMIFNTTGLGSVLPMDDSVEDAVDQVAAIGNCR